MVSDGILKYKGKSVVWHKTVYHTTLFSFADPIDNCKLKNSKLFYNTRTFDENFYNVLPYLSQTGGLPQTEKTPSSDGVFYVGITYLPGKSPCKYCRRK